MLKQTPAFLHLQARTPGPRERVVVVTEDPSFWVGLRKDAPELEHAWLLANTARECLEAVEDPRVQVVVLDGALNDRPANQLLQLVKRIRPTLPVVFAFLSPREEWEREARQAGVLYYGDRAGTAEMVRVVRQNLRRIVRPRPRGVEPPPRES
ncbi:MAG: response regulator transcription factor [Candidatus Eisenbacteria bacterium]|nr:response regulator transcription factor [Candidatus Eisenbacteria bacterium]